MAVAEFNFNKSQSQNSCLVVIYKKTTKRTSILLTEDMYAFGTCWNSQCPVPSDQFISFSKDEFPEDTNYFDRIAPVHFSIRRIMTHLATFYVLTNNSEKSLYLWRSSAGDSFHRLNQGDQRILRQDDFIAVAPKNLGRLIQFHYFYDIPYDDVYQIIDKYFVGLSIGRGANANVHVLYDVANQNDEGKFKDFALKAIHKSKLLDELMKKEENEKIMREVEAMRKLDNPHILKLVNYFNLPDTLFLIMPHLCGGNLIKRIINYNPNQKWMDENEARFFFHQLLIGVKYMHAKGYAHRDLKPDNILLTDRSSHPLLVIADLGLTKKLTLTNTICGTAGYAAPEIHQDDSHYDDKIDLWSCGVILYAMLSGIMPFDKSYKASTGLNLKEQIIGGKYSFKHRSFQNVSQSAKLLISSLLQIETQKRWDANLALAHKWVNNKSTKELIKQAYESRGINYIDQLEDAMRRTSIGDSPPPAKRHRKKT